MTRQWCARCKKWRRFEVGHGKEPTGCWRCGTEAADPPPDAPPDPLLDAIPKPKPKPKPKPEA